MIVHGLTDKERRQAYAADITYGTNNEFGFDYLRDNMKFKMGHIDECRAIAEDILVIGPGLLKILDHPNVTVVILQRQ